MQLPYKKNKYCFTFVLLCICFTTQAQFTAPTSNAFYSSNSFIENKGQYGKTYKGQEQLGTILYGYEGNGMPILFTPKGIIFLQRKVKTLSHSEKEKLEKQGVPEEEIEHKITAMDRAITMEWVGANTDVQIIETDKTHAYHTYGMLPEKAYGYKQITYKNLYNGIDLVYHFTNHEKIGFEYSLQVAAGADISQIKMQYGGDVKKLKLNKQGILIIDSDIEGIAQAAPISFYGDNAPIASTYQILYKQVSFTLPNGYDSSKAITIDPFVSSTSNLDGLNVGKAKDIDFDYAGNVYVTGGGNPLTNHRLAKYNANGVLQWTFNGVLANPVWEFGASMGGWVVEKNTGKIYLGQGDKYLIGFRVVRLDQNGLYDNFITVANPNFNENWKMAWTCNNGVPEILIGGGGVI